MLILYTPTAQSVAARSCLIQEGVEPLWSDASRDPAVDLDGGAERAVTEAEDLVKGRGAVLGGPADVGAEPVLRVCDEFLGTRGLARLGTADTHVRADGRRLAEVVVEADHAVHVRA